MASTSQRPEESAFQILVSKYHANPLWFDQNLPEIGEIMRQAGYSSQRSQSPFGLTDRERRYHSEALFQIGHVDKLSVTDSIKALEHCAALIRNDSLPYEIGHETRVLLFRSAFGKSPESFKANATIPIGDQRGGEPTYRVPLVRGVVMNLNLNMSLVSVTVTPSKVKEREKLMSIVGIGRDSATDVAARHDDYLAEQSPHAAP